MTTEFKKICVLGLGYVGLPTAAIFASRGVQVVGVDINEKTVETINQGKIHIVEPGLDIMVNGAVSAGKLVAAPGPQSADAYIIAVPTPFKDANKPDLAFVEAAVRSIAPVLEKGALVILESTSPVGTTEKSVSGWPRNATISPSPMWQATVPMFRFHTALKGYCLAMCLWNLLTMIGSSVVFRPIVPSAPSSFTRSPLKANAC